MNSSASSPELLLGSEPDRDWHARIAGRPSARRSRRNPDAARHAIALILTCPEAQLA